MQATALLSMCVRVCVCVHMHQWTLRPSKKLFKAIFLPLRQKQLITKDEPQQD